jgi:hypothetical protein
MTSHVNINTSLVITFLVVVVVLVLDILITRLPVYTYRNRSSDVFIAFFAFEVVLFAISQILFLRSVKAINSEKMGNDLKMSELGITYSIVSVSQYALIAILSFTLIEIAITDTYSTYLVKAAISIACLLSIIVLALLIRRFLLWLKYNRDYLTVAYTIAITMIALNSAFILLYLTQTLRNSPEFIYPLRPSSNNTIVTYSAINTAYNVTSVLAFISMWFASVLLLRHYSTKIGKAKFWLIVSIPLIYFLGQFQFAFVNIFTTFRLLDPDLFFRVFTIGFSITKPIGGLLFGIAFWTIAKSIPHTKIKDYMKLSALGIILLFISNQVAGLTVLPYPPFGLATISFMGLSSYLMFIGIYYSAVAVAGDLKIRTSIKKSVEQQIMFLGKIGTSQMEQEIHGKVKNFTTKLAHELEEHSNVQIPTPEQEIKDYVAIVIREKQRLLLKESSEVKIYHREDMPRGRSWEEWVELWWRWYYSKPQNISPIVDTTGEHCREGQIHDGIWFLSGTLGGKEERTCEVPSGRAILFPILNDLISFATHPQLKSEAELCAYAKADLDKTKFLYTKVDGIELKNLETCRVQSALFNISLPSDYHNEDPVSTLAASDGYWVFLKPLTVGEHTIEFVGEKLTFDQLHPGNSSSDVPKFRGEVTYHLRVV